MIELACCFLEHIDVLTEGFNLEQFRNTDIQLNFYHGFRGVNHKSIIEALEREKVRVISLHLPNIAISDPYFMQMLEESKEFYGVNLVTTHPVKATYTGRAREDITEDDVARLRDKELDALVRNSGAIRDLGVIICLENFPQNRYRWVSQPHDLYQLASEFPNLAITYDFSHTEKNLNLEKEFATVADKTRIIHASNRDTSDNDKWKVHLPISEGELPAVELLETLDKLSFHGQVILEYKKKYRQEMIADYRLMRGLSS
ncbi:TIM barrel protein [Candidatus Woesearchaeota archaeon]|nr:TIM barrel protein [Candidatus Woesearchaeota archaeon]